jgi:hypothetical protein
LDHVLAGGERLDIGLPETRHRELIARFDRGQVMAGHCLEAPDAWVSAEALAIRSDEPDAHMVVVGAVGDPGALELNARAIGWAVARLPQEPTRTRGHRSDWSIRKRFARADSPMT